MKIPIFIINLESDFEKKKHINALCIKYGLLPVFIKAIKGNDLSDKAVQTAYPKQLAIDTFGRELSKPELGCAMSHKLIYQKIVDDNIDIALVLEDDADFGQDLVHCLNSITKFPKDLEVALFGHYRSYDHKAKASCSLWGRKALYQKYILKKPIQPSYGCHGYCITNGGARKILNDFAEITMTIDHLVGKPDFVNVYVLDPRVVFVHQELFKNSSIEGSRKKMCNKYYNDYRKSFKRKVLEYFKIYGLALYILDLLKSGLLKIKPFSGYK